METAKCAMCGTEIDFAPDSMEAAIHIMFPNVRIACPECVAESGTVDQLSENL